MLFMTFFLWIQFKIFNFQNFILSDVKMNWLVWTFILVGYLQLYTVSSHHADVDIHLENIPVNRYKQLVLAEKVGFFLLQY